MFLGIDLGTSGVKLTLIDFDGNIIGEAGSSYPFYGIEQGYWEHDPDDWTESIISSASDLRTKTSANHWKSIKAIGLSAQMPTMVILGKDGRVLDRSITWCDSRADEQGHRLLNIWGREEHYCKTGVRLDGRYLIPMYLWIRENKPGIISSPHYILSAKDYLYYWMCGEVKTDPSTASGFAVYDIKKGIWDEELCNKAHISMDSLPAIGCSSDRSPGLTEQFRKKLFLPEDVTVCLGAADSVAGVLGMGADGSGIICQICGSSTAILATCTEINMDPADKYFVTPLAKPYNYALEADILSTGETSRWVARLIGTSIDRLSEIATKSPPGSEGVIFTPYFAGGEQSVLWDPSLSGSMIGLSSRHDSSHIVRAHYEGICYEARRCTDAFSGSGFKARRVLMTGPVTKDSFFMQLMADILGMECTASDKNNASAFGAAVLAGISTGDFDWSFTASLSSGQKSYMPDPNCSFLYNGYYEKYLKVSRNSKL